MLLFVTTATQASRLFSYLGNWVKRVRPLRRREAHVEDASGHLAAEGHPLDGLPHSLLGAHRYFKAAKRTTVPEADVMFDINWNRHQAGKERDKKPMSLMYRKNGHTSLFLPRWQLFLPHLLPYLTK